MWSRHHKEGSRGSPLYARLPLLSVLPVTIYDDKLLMNAILRLMFANILYPKPLSLFIGLTNNLYQAGRAV